MRLSHAIATHQGQRDNNEDSALAVPGLYAVADGMGGHAAGEVASRIAVETLQVSRNIIAAGGPKFYADGVLRMTFVAVRALIGENVKAHPENAGMGTTLTALAIRDGNATIAHVGDSRCYLVRAGIGKQLTTDHATRRGLLNCLGSSPSAHTGTDIAEIAVQPGDVFVLCTDGLADYADADAVAGVVAGVSEPRRMADALVEYALEAGGADNVTVVVVRVE